MIERRYTVGAPDHRPPGMIPEGREWTERRYSHEEFLHHLGLPLGTKLISIYRMTGELIITFEEAPCEPVPSAGGSRSGSATA